MATLAEALHVVRNHTWDHSEHLHDAGGWHPLGNDITDAARAILSRLSDSGHILVEREAWDRLRAALTEVAEMCDHTSPYPDYCGGCRVRATLSQP